MAINRTSKTLYPPLPILGWLVLTLVLVTLPHLFRTAGWVFPVFLGLLGWRLVGFYQQRWLPNYFFQLVITGFILGGIILTYHTFFGRDVGVSLLILLCSLKFMETNSHRDAMLLCFLGYFLAITHFLYSQTILKAIYMSVTFVILTATLITITDNDQHLSARQRLRFAIILLLQALPLMLVIFILFPRVPGPLWGLPKDVRQGLTGLSEQMTLGDVSELSLSDEVAFRVKFNGTIPPYPQRYWRGPLLWRTDGRTWKGGHEDKMPENSALRALGPAVDYTVTLEPHYKRWLFALDMPAKIPADVGFLTRDYQVLATLPIYQRLRYTLTSYPDYQARALTPLQRRMALYLPPTMHPRAKTLALQWKQENADPRALVHRALEYFSQAGFTYSYTPPFLANEVDPLDSFLFASRQGFCEHYAAALTVLMRAAGVPTRIVTGYLGGHVNPLDNYLTIRQQDAHAWSEVWLEKQGWVRVDPTAVVAPERINDSRGEFLTGDVNSQQTVKKSIWQQLYYGWEALDNAWNQWVLNYDQKRQQQLFKALGLKEIDWRGLTILLVMLGSSLLFGLGIWLAFRPAERKTDPAQRLYWKFCQKLARRGLTRHPSEGPLAYATRIIHARPELTLVVQRITLLYVQIRYRSQPERLTQLATHVRRFRP